MHKIVSTTSDAGFFRRYALKLAHLEASRREAMKVHAVVIPGSVFFVWIAFWNPAGFTLTETWQRAAMLGAGVLAAFLLAHALLLAAGGYFGSGIWTQVESSRERDIERSARVV